MEKHTIKKRWGFTAIISFMVITVSTSSGVSIYLDDTTPPVTTLSFDPEIPDGNNDWYISNVTVTLNATDDSSGVNITYYKINEGDWQIYENPFLLNTSNYYTIQYYSVDIAGNVEDTKTASCKVDVVPPVTTYHIDQGGVYHIFSLSATDDMSGVFITYIQIDCGTWQTYHGEITLTSDSPHIMRFYSIDKAGNVEDTKQVIIHPHTDTFPPTIHLTVKKVFFNKWKFIAEAYDTISGMDRVEFYVDNQLLGNISGPGPLYECNWVCPDSNSHLVQAIAYDCAGNSASSNIIISISKSHNYGLYFNQLFLKSLKRFFHMPLLLTLEEKLLHMGRK